VSKAVADECRNAGFPKVVRIENGIELERFNDPHRQPRAKRLTLINVARFQPSVKGQDLLIDAVAMCRASGLDVTCTLVGPHAPPVTLCRQIEALRLKDHVKFVVDPENVSSCLHSADIFVLPSRSEAFGVALLEAMAAGLPVIASRTGGPAELIEEGRNGLMFEPGNVADLAAGIGRLASDLGLGNRLAVQSEETARRFSIDRMTARYYGLYDDLLRTGASVLSPSSAPGRPCVEDEAFDTPNKPAGGQ
jgi:glycosyltransferase involved in cell wall biosynthesis